MATLRTPGGDVPRDPHDPKDGSLVFSASMLALLGGKREASNLGIDICAHSRSIEGHPLASRVAPLAYALGVPA